MHFSSFRTLVEISCPWLNNPPQRCREAAVGCTFFCSLRFAFDAQKLPEVVDLKASVTGSRRIVRKLLRVRRYATVVSLTPSRSTQTCLLLYHKQVNKVCSGERKTLWSRLLLPLVTTLFNVTLLTQPVLQRARA